ncbi:transposase [Microcoleus sp. AS-A8]
MMRKYHVPFWRAAALVRESLTLISGNSLVAGEKLNIKGMTATVKKGKRKAQKAGLNRSILDVGFGLIGQMLEYKLAEAGGFYVESPTQTLKPTQRCATCWELTPKTLADTVHVCSNPNCNHTEDRDVNAAQVNITWARGQELSSLGAESLSSTACDRQAATRGEEALLNDNLLLGLETPTSAIAGRSSSFKLQ